MPNLAFDLDGCLVDFCHAWNQRCAALAGEDKCPGVSDYVNEPAIWDWDKAAYGADLTHAVWQQVMKDPRFWEKLRPMPEAERTLKVIEALAKEGHNIYFITARTGVNVKRQTEKWLYKYGVSYPTVLVSDNKLPLLEHLGVTFFVDDKPSTVEEVYIAHPQWKTYVRDQPYNRALRVNVPRVGSVEEALKLNNLWKEIDGRKANKTSQS